MRRISRERTRSKHANCFGSSQSSRAGSDSACSVVRSRSDCISTYPICVGDLSDMVFAKFPHPLIEYPKASRDSPKDSHQAPEELAIMVPNPAHCIHSSDVVQFHQPRTVPIGAAPNQNCSCGCGHCRADHCVQRKLRTRYLVLYEKYVLCNQCFCLFLYKLH